MAFREYLEMLNQLDSMEFLVNSTDYLSKKEKEWLIEGINRFRIEYETAILECGDYPTI